MKHSQLMVIDNYFEPEFYEKILDEVHNFKWSLYGVSSIDIPGKHWRVDFVDNDQASNADPVDGLINVPIVAEIWEKLRQGHLRGHELVRVNANAHTFGTEGHLHIDRCADGHCFTVVYALARWKPEFAGESVFYTESGELIDAVLPAPNRVITFQSTSPHGGRALAQHCKDLRMLFDFKTRIPQPPKG